MLLTELFDTPSLSQAAQQAQVTIQRQDRQQWVWQFQVTDAQGQPEPFCFRATNLARGFFLPPELSSSWGLNLIQAQCSHDLTPTPQTLDLMGNVGNMGTRGALQVFVTCGSLIQQLIQEGQAQALVFNGEPSRASLYEKFARLISARLGWTYQTYQGHWPIHQHWYIFSSGPVLLKRIVRVFQDLGQIDSK